MPLLSRLDVLLLDENCLAPPPLFHDQAEN